MWKYKEFVTFEQLAGEQLCEFLKDNNVTEFVVLQGAKGYIEIAYKSQ